MKRNQFIGGIVLLTIAALIFFTQDSSATVPTAITLTVVGIVLVAGSNRRKAL